MPDLSGKLRGWLGRMSGRPEKPDGEPAAARPEKRKSLFPWVILLLGLCGILLLSAGDCARSQPAQTSEPASASLEEDVVRLVAAISGDPKPVVALTYVQGEEYLYEFDERQTAAGSEREVARYEDASGRDQGLVRTTRAPEVAGVAVVCRGGTDASIRLRVTEAVATALRLSADRVYVTAKGAD